MIRIVVVGTGRLYHTEDASTGSGIAGRITVAGAEASARVFSLFESARTNGHNPQRYLSVLLTQLPNVNGVEDVEAFLPWNPKPDEVAKRYALYPAP